MSNNLRDAINAIKAGDKARGRQLLIDFVRTYPRNELAWLWMSAVVDTDEGRRQCLEFVLEINPNNTIAQQGLTASQTSLTKILPPDAPEFPVPTEQEASPGYIDRLLLPITQDVTNTTGAIVGGMIGLILSIITGVILFLTIGWAVAIVGPIIAGGAIGRSIGGRRHRDVWTFAGAVVGAISAFVFGAGGLILFALAIVWPIIGLGTGIRIGGNSATAVSRKLEAWYGMRWWLKWRFWLSLLLIATVIPGLATIILELQPCGKLDRTLQLSGCQIKIRTGKYGIDPIDLISNGQILVGVDGYREDNVQLWQTSDATLMHRLKADAGEVWSSAQIRNVALSWDNKTLAVQHESTFELWRLNDGILLTAFSVGKDVIQRIALAPDGTMLAIASGNYGQLHRTIDGTLALSLWSYSDDDLEHSGREITQLCFSPAGSVLASGTLSGTIELWDIETGTLLQTFASDSELMSLTFSPDGSLLAYGTIDGKIHLHQASTGVLVRTFEGHREPVKRLRFSPDGTLLASAGDEPMVYLWQVDQGILIKTKKIYTKETPTSLTFSPQGELIFSSTQHNSPIVRLWQVK